jgi:hypothetical protein
MLLKLNATNEVVQEDVSFPLAGQVTDIECPLVGLSAGVDQVHALGQDVSR